MAHAWHGMCGTYTLWALSLILERENEKTTSPVKCQDPGATCASPAVVSLSMPGTEHIAGHERLRLSSFAIQ